MTTEKMQKKLNLYFVFQIIILLICWAEILIFWKRIPPQIPWFYSLSWGESQLMKKGGLFLVMGLSSVLSIATSYIANWAKKGDSIVEKTVLIALLLASTLLLLNLTRVLMIFVI